MSTSKACPVCKTSRPLTDFRPTATGFATTCTNCRNPGAPLADRFWAKVNKRGKWDCWEWKASRFPDGYGQFRTNPKLPPQRASRVAWSLTFGDPGRLHVLHRCDNPPCCNPRHLFLGTGADNSLDCRQKGRWKAGQAFSLARRRLTDEQILEARARRAAGETYRSIGRLLGVHHTTILRLVNGTHWTGHSITPE